MFIWSNEHVLHSETSLSDYQMEVNAVSAFHEVFSMVLIWKHLSLSYENNPEEKTYTYKKDMALILSQI